MIWQKNSLRLLNVCLKLLYDSNTSISEVEYSSSTTRARCIVVRSILEMVLVNHVVWWLRGVANAKQSLLCCSLGYNVGFVRAT